MIRLIHSLSTWLSGIWGKSCLIILAVPSFILGILVCCKVSITHDIGARRNKRLWLITYKMWLSEIWFMFFKCFSFFSLQISLVLRTSRFQTKNYSGELHFIEFYDENCFTYLRHNISAKSNVQESLRIANVFNRCGS